MFAILLIALLDKKARDDFWGSKSTSFCVTYVVLEDDFTNVFSCVLTDLDRTNPVMGDQKGYSFNYGDCFVPTPLGIGFKRAFSRCLPLLAELIQFDWLDLIQTGSNHKLDWFLGSTPANSPRDRSEPWIQGGITLWIRRDQDGPRITSLSWYTFLCVDGWYSIVIYSDTVDGRNPAPHGMYETL